jgi:hypothetical protein
MDNIEIFNTYTRKTIMFWVSWFTQDGREDFPEDLKAMIKNPLSAEGNVLEFMIAVLNPEQTDDAIDDAIACCSPYDKIMAKIVASNLQVLQDVKTEDIESASIDLLQVTGQELEEIFNLEITQLRDYYEEQNLLEELKGKVESGVKGFGMWILTLENEENPPVAFNPKNLMDSSILNLSFTRCAEYYYFIASKMVMVEVS